MKAILIGLGLGFGLMTLGFILVVLTDEEVEFAPIPTRPVGSPMHRGLSDQERRLISDRVKPVMS